MLGFLPVCFLCAHTVSAQLSPKIQAETEYGLYPNIIADSASITTAEDRAALAEAYYRTGRTDYAAQVAHSALGQPYALLVAAKCFAIAGTKDSACNYLSQYLAQPDKLPRAKILLDTVFAKMQKEACWKAIWKQEWYPQPTEQDKLSQLIAAGRYDETLDQIQNKGSQADKFTYWKAEALIGLGQDRDALKVLRNARTEQELALRWKMEHASAHDRTALQVAQQYSARCGRCITAEKMLAISAYNTSDFADAQKHLDKYLAIYYMDAEALCLQARILADQSRFLDALEVSNNAMKFSPQYAPAALLRGDIFCQVNNWELAAKMYQQYLDWKGGSADVYFKLGNALLNAGNRTQACREMEFAKHFGSLPAVDFYRLHCLK